jgi:hypothetical protein
VRFYFSGRISGQSSGLSGIIIQRWLNVLFGFPALAGGMRHVGVTPLDAPDRSGIEVADDLIRFSPCEAGIVGGGHGALFVGVFRCLLRLRMIVCGHGRSSSVWLQKTKQSLDDAGTLHDLHILNLYI